MKQHFFVVVGQHTTRSILVAKSISKAVSDRRHLLLTEMLTQNVKKAMRPSAELITNCVYRSRCSFTGSLGRHGLLLPSSGLSASNVHAAQAADAVRDMSLFYKGSPHSWSSLWLRRARAVGANGSSRACGPTETDVREVGWSNFGDDLISV